MMKMMNEDEDLDLKEKILQEIMEKMDEQEGMKIKPKVAKLDVMAVKPEMEDGESDMPESMDSEGAMGDEDEDKEKLKMLLQSYMERKL